MDKYINSYEGYSFWELSHENLYELAKFIVIENYKHHQSDKVEMVDIEVAQVFDEELQYLPNSRIFAVRDRDMEIVGAIRILKWNHKDVLPITKLFDISSFHQIDPIHSKEHIWHIGRFAISNKVGKFGIVLFKILMSSVISMICKNDNGVMLSECDSKLLKTLHLMNIAAMPLSDGIEYLGSLTIPMYVTRDGLEVFYNNHKQLSLIKH